MSNAKLPAPLDVMISSTCRTLLKPAFAEEISIETEKRKTIFEEAQKTYEDLATRFTTTAKSGDLNPLSKSHENDLKVAKSTVEIANRDLELLVGSQSEIERDLTVARGIARDLKKIANAKKAVASEINKLQEGSPEARTANKDAEDAHKASEIAQTVVREADRALGNGIDGYKRAKAILRMGMGDTTLSELRKILQRRINSYRLPGVDKQIFDVWINEGALSEPINQTALEVCLSKVRKSEIIVILYTGEAGLPGEGSNNTDGACLKEAHEAFKYSPHSTIVINIESLIQPTADATEIQNNKSMVDWMTKIMPTFTLFPKSFRELLTAVDENLFARVVELSRAGHAHYSAVGHRSIGPALDWSLKTLVERQDAMTNALSLAVSIDKPVKNIEFVTGKFAKVGSLSFGTSRLTVVLSAVPGTLSQSPSRETWGRPDLYEKELWKESNSEHPGPIHIVGVRGGITEIQAHTLLNNPNAFAVKTEFGVWAADDGQGTQFLLLANCEDEITTHRAVDTATSWLLMTQEKNKVIPRAIKRRKVVKALATPM